MEGDSDLTQFMEGESQRARYQALVHELTAKCWDMCVDKPSARMDAKTETCLGNCVNRFIDTTNYIVERLEKKADALGISEV